MKKPAYTPPLFAEYSFLSEPQEPLALRKSSILRWEVSDSE